MRKKLFILFLLFPALAYGAPPARQASYETNTVISSTEVTNNEDVIYSYLQAGVDTYKDDTIVNADVNSAANIQSSKLNLTAIAQDMAIVSSGSFTNAAATTLNGDVTVGDGTDSLTINASGGITITPATTWTFTDSQTVSGTWTDLGTVTTADINGGTLDNVQIGGTTATGELIVNDSSDDANGLGSQGNSGQILQSQGSGSNPTWVNAGGGAMSIFGSQVGLNGDGTCDGDGEVNVDIDGTYCWSNSGNGSPTTFYSIPWLKTAMVSTVKGKIYIDPNNTHDATLELDIGGQTDSVAVSAGAVVLSDEISVDVSGLTNGTWYTFALSGDHAGSGANVVDSELEAWGFYAQ